MGGVRAANWEERAKDGREITHVTAYEGLEMVQFS